MVVVVPFVAVCTIWLDGHTEDTSTIISSLLVRRHRSRRALQITKLSPVSLTPITGQEMEFAVIPVPVDPSIWVVKSGVILNDEAVVEEGEDAI
ncbi:hypothetical protein ACJRO7_029203 [Eucalyptus globulus]|uniref:Uncharacterized protein n=1 Tax=Eucalyptus globulus TaxID=34317 RepID=A0ABD3JZS4_EUCGL